MFLFHPSNRMSTKDTSIPVAARWILLSVPTAIQSPLFYLRVPIFGSSSSFTMIYNFLCLVIALAASVLLLTIQNAYVVHEKL